MAAASVTEYGDPATDAEMLARALADDRAGPRDVRRCCWPTATGTPTCRWPSRCRRQQALQARGVPCELLLFEGEGHTLVGQDSVARLGESVAGWFDSWL